ncbi:MAG TPA: indole-3-glycerol phosphate synthase TrpC [Pirellulales bacterium]|nr:indole-3-glycerol phosphate synthase TrpC [Pirellulales bacterium]
MSVLDKIIASKQREIEAAKAAQTEAQVRAAAEKAPPPRNFFAALAGPGPIKLIAEVKKASPSAGVIRADFKPVERARIYQQHGAACLSVLTDEPFFQGKLEYLRDIRAAVALPVLRKDFILEKCQLYEARAAGADAVLLIAECLDDCHLRALHNETIALGMTPLVELYEPANLQRVLDVGATLIGINNRDLHTFKTDLEHTLRLREQVPDSCILVAESGIRTRADVQRLEAAGVNAILVGETLMASPNIGAAVDALLRD